MTGSFRRSLSTPNLHTFSPSDTKRSGSSSEADDPGEGGSAPIRRSNSYPHFLENSRVKLARDRGCSSVTVDSIFNYEYITSQENLPGKFSEKQASSAENSAEPDLENPHSRATKKEVEEVKELFPDVAFAHSHRKVEPATPVNSSSQVSDSSQQNTTGQHPVEGTLPAKTLLDSHLKNNPSPSPEKEVKGSPLSTASDLSSMEEEEEKGIRDLSHQLQISISLAADAAALASKWFSWFTILRLFSIRVCREWYVIHHIFTVSWRGYTDILQFSYALEIIPSLVRLAHNPTLLTSDHEWQSAFTNALVWLIVNGISFATSAAWVNLVGFAFDIWHDYYYAYAKEEMEKLLETRNTLQEKDKDGDCNLENANAIADINQQIKILECKKWRATLVAIGIFIGMTMLYMHAIAPFCVPMIGATLVIFFGGILGNLGNRLFQWDKFLVGLCGTSSWQDFFKDTRKTIQDSFGKLLQEYIQPLSPTLYNSLANVKEDPLHTFNCIMAASLPLSVFVYASQHFSVFLFSSLVSAHIVFLLSIAATLIAIEICTRVISNLIKPENIPNLITTLETNLENNSSKKHADAFAKLTPRQIETLAKRAELSIKELLRHIYHWDKEGNSAEDNANSAPKVSTCRYSLFNKFKEQVSSAPIQPAQKLQVSSPGIYPLAYF